MKFRENFVRTESLGEKTRTRGRGMIQLLVVDDGDDIRLSLQSLFSENGFEVAVAANGEEGLAQLKETPDIKVAIVDVVMPIMDGITMVEHLRNDLENTATKIIFLTSEHNDEFTQRCKPLKITGWILKPYKEGTLLKLIQRMIKL